MNSDLYLTGTTQLKNSLIIALFAFLFKLVVCLKEIFETGLHYLVLDTMSRCLLNRQLVWQGRMLKCQFIIRSRMVLTSAKPL